MKEVFQPSNKSANRPLPPQGGSGLPSCHNYITLQLSVPALEKLMGDSGAEVVLGLRKTVIEEFTRRRIKALCTETERVAITKLVADLVGTTKYSGSQGETVVLKDPLKQAIYDETENVVRNAINAEMAESRERVMAYAKKRLANLEEDQKDELDRLILLAVSRSEQYILNEVDRRVAAVLATTQTHDQRTT